MDLDIALTVQKNALDELLTSKSALDSDAAIKREYDYYNVAYVRIRASAASRSHRTRPSIRIGRGQRIASNAASDSH